MQSAFVYAGVIGLVFGIFTRSLLSFGLPEILLLAVISLALCIIGRRKGEALSAPFLLLMGVFLLLFACGALHMEWASYGEINPQFEKLLGVQQDFEGVVVREVEERERTVHAYVDIGSELVLVTAEKGIALAYGDRVVLSGKLERPEAFATELGRTFDYPGYLRARGVSYMLSYAQVHVAEHGQGNAVFAALLQFKHQFVHTIQSVLPPEQAGLSVGLLLGVKQSLGEELEAAFRDAGIMHIVVLSGYNIMLVVLFVTYVLSFVLPWRLRLFVGLLAIVAFACMVGLSATVVRASIMAGLILCAKFIGSTYDVMRALLFTGCVMLIINPYLLVFDVGFQLSFVATLGLILLSPAIEKWASFMPKTFGLREFFTATVATQIFVLPILLYQIGAFSVVALPVNLLVLPMVPIAMLLTFATGMLGFFSIALAQVCAYLAALSLSYIIAVAEFFAALPFASFTFPAFPFLFVAVMYVALLYMLLRISIWKTQEDDQLRNWTIVNEEELQTKQTIAEKTPPVFFR